jgi:hypothetical protein
MIRRYELLAGGQDVTSINRSSAVGLMYWALAGGIRVNLCQDGACFRFGIG